MRHCIALLLFLASVCVPQSPPASATADPATKAPLMVEWNSAPTLVGNAVKGSVTVTNQAEDDFDQTLIIEAVNESGKAFALGYQHFTLRRHSRSSSIAFNSTLPPGHYTVHADAVAEVASKHAIYRQHLEAPAGFVVTVI